MGTTFRTGLLAALSVGALVLTTSAAHSGPTVPTLQPGVGAKLPDLPPTAKRILTLPFSPKVTGVQPTADAKLKRTLNGGQNTCGIGLECLLYGANLGKHGRFAPTPDGVTLTYTAAPTPANTITPKPPGAGGIAPLPVPAAKPRPATTPTIVAWTDDLVGFLVPTDAEPGHYRVSIKRGASVIAELDVKFAKAGGRDADGDGHVSVDIGGDDCDDLDPFRYTGNTEVPDANDHDEDCNPVTFGNRDADNDGAPDAAACNVKVVGNGLDRTLEYQCGSDCNDNNTSIVPGVMMCDPRIESAIFVCRGNTVNRWPSDPRRTLGMDWDPFDCASFLPGGRCVPQPNGTGVCR